MENDGDVVIIDNDETCEVKAIKAYLAKEISAKGLAHSLGVTRSYAYKLVK